MKFDFLKSRRFWSLVVIAIIGVLESEAILSSDIANAIIVLLGGFIGIRTIDRFSEKIK
jgi:hypothetical protein